MRIYRPTARCAWANICIVLYFIVHHPPKSTVGFTANELCVFTCGVCVCVWVCASSSITIHSRGAERLELVHIVRKNMRNVQTKNTTSHTRARSLWYSVKTQNRKKWIFKKDTNLPVCFCCAMAKESVENSEIFQNIRNRLSLLGHHASRSHSQHEKHRLAFMSLAFSIEPKPYGAWLRITRTHHNGILT